MNAQTGHYTYQRGSSPAGAYYTIRDPWDGNIAIASNEHQARTIVKALNLLAGIQVPEAETFAVSCLYQPR